MSWSKTQNQMIHELNESVFSRDPINRIYDPMCPIDVQNTNYVMELKNREKYNPQDFDGSLIEKMKYDYLVNNANGKIPGYVCKFRDGSYWAWNLNKIKPEWYEKDLPTTSHFTNNKFKPKTVGDLKLKDGVKLK
jgi:arginyl-tRNA synthetase